MNWIDEQVSLYESHADNFGRPAKYREILLTECTRDIDTIIALRKLDRELPDYEARKKVLKAKLQCFTPSALLDSKQKNNLQVRKRTNIMQLDFDKSGISDFDIDELKACVFNLPFIAFCGLSCSGDGFYALALISEPERLADYAEHCFCILENFGIKADTSKGKKVENLRYVSYDSNMLIRDNPEVLKISQFRKKKELSITGNESAQKYLGTDDAISLCLARIANVQVGERWPTVQKYAYMLGGFGDKHLIRAIISEIENNKAFDHENDKYIACAKDCFNAGYEKPIPIKTA